jgi:hypothetical protein
MFLKKKNPKTELLYDLKEMMSGSYRDSCSPMFLAILFSVAKTWEQPKCPGMDEQI